MDKPRFKLYLINETNQHLAQKIGDILTALQSLNDDAKHLGSRQLIQACKGISNQIRKILKDNWPDTSLDALKSLQKVGVALMRAIDSNQDIKETIASAVQELQQTSNDLGQPINDLSPPEDNEEHDDLD